MPSRNYHWRRIGRKVLIASLILIMGGIFLFGQRGLYRFYRLQRSKSEMVRRNDSLNVEIQIIFSRVEALQKRDLLELERIARQWGMVRPGEEIYIIKEEKDTTATLP